MPSDTKLERPRAVFSTEDDKDGHGITLLAKPGAELDGAVVVVGMPTVGLVGTIAARYLAQKLEMPLVGGWRSSHFPPVTLVQGGQPAFPIQTYSLETRCGLGLDCERVVVIAADFLPSSHVLHHLSDAITRWASDSGAELVIVPDGIPADGDPGDKVQGIAATAAGRSFLQSADVESIEDGAVMGLSGALVADGYRLGTDTVCLLTETHQEHPDARAAARIVSLLDRVIPDIKVESKPLVEQAEQIESYVRDLQRKVQQQKSKQDEDQGRSSMMFT